MSARGHFINPLKYNKLSDFVNRILTRTRRDKMAELRVWNGAQNAHTAIARTTQPPAKLSYSNMHEDMASRPKEKVESSFSGVLAAEGQLCHLPPKSWPNAA